MTLIAIIGIVNSLLLIGCISPTSLYFGDVWKTLKGNPADIPEKMKTEFSKISLPHADSIDEKDSLFGYVIEKGNSRSGSIIIGAPFQRTAEDVYSGLVWECMIGGDSKCLPLSNIEFDSPSNSPFFRTSYGSSVIRFNDDNYRVCGAYLSFDPSILPHCSNVHRRNAKLNISNLFENGFSKKPEYTWSGDEHIVNAYLYYKEFEQENIGIGFGRCYKLTRWGCPIIFHKYEVNGESKKLSKVLFLELKDNELVDYVPTLAIGCGYLTGPNVVSCVFAANDYLLRGLLFSYTIDFNADRITLKQIMNNTKIERDSGFGMNIEVIGKQDLVFGDLLVSSPYAEFSEIQMAGVVYIFPNTKTSQFFGDELILITGDSEPRGMFGYGMNTFNVNNDAYIDVAIMQLHSPENRCGVIYIYFGNDPIKKIYLTFQEKIYPSSTSCSESLGYGFRVYQKSDFNNDQVRDIAVTSIFAAEVSLILMRKPVSLSFDITVDPIVTSTDFNWDSRIITQTLNICPKTQNDRDELALIRLATTIKIEHESQNAEFYSDPSAMTYEGECLRPSYGVKVIVNLLIQIGSSFLYQHMDFHYEIVDKTYEEDHLNCRSVSKYCRVFMGISGTIRQPFTKTCSYEQSYSINGPDQQNLHLIAGEKNTLSPNIIIKVLGCFSDPIHVRVHIQSICTVTSSSPKFIPLPHFQTDLHEYTTFVYKSAIEIDEEIAFPHKISCREPSFSTESYQLQYDLYEITSSLQHRSQIFRIPVMFSWNIDINPTSIFEKRMPKNVETHLELIYSFDVLVRGIGPDKNIRLSVEVESMDDEIVMRSDVEAYNGDARLNTLCQIDPPKSYPCRALFIFFEPTVDSIAKLNIKLPVKAKINETRTVSISISLNLLNINRYIHQERLTSMAITAQANIVPEIKTINLVLVITGSAFGSLVVLLLIIFLLFKLKIHRKLFPEYSESINYVVIDDIENIPSKSLDTNVESS